MRDRSCFEEYIKVFINQNEKLNLVSKNDANLLWEKHIFDSLAIEEFFKKYSINTKGLKFLDIGTGGGFPSVPIALSYPETEVYALDSIRKKINTIENFKAELNIKNLHTICERAEKISGKFDIITSRAVAPLKVIAEYAAPLLKSNGYFVAYKSLKVNEEIEEAQNVLKKHKLCVKDIIEYKLPLEENYVRNLVVISRY